MRTSLGGAAEASVTALADFLAAEKARGVPGPETGDQGADTRSIEAGMKRGTRSKSKQLSSLCKRVASP
jgi:hypothetical protein